METKQRKQPSRHLQASKYVSLKIKNNCKTGTKPYCTELSPTTFSKVCLQGLGDSLINPVCGLPVIWTLVHAPSTRQLHTILPRNTNAKTKSTAVTESPQQTSFYLDFQLMPRACSVVNLCIVCFVTRWHH